MRQTPFFTVGLMTYNNAEFIEKAIESVLNQSFEDWELIISDDNSTDNTEQVVAKYLDSPRIRYIKQERNLGQANNWKFLITNANANVFATLHADDFWSPTYLEVAYDFFLLNEKLDILQFNWKVIDVNGDFLYYGPIKADRSLVNMKSLESQLDLYSTLPSTTVFRLPFARNVYFPNELYKYAVDFDFFIRLFACSKMVVQRKDALVYYRSHDASTSSIYGKGLHWEKERKILLENLLSYFSGLGIERRYHRYLKTNIAMGVLNDALSRSKKKEYQASFRLLKEAIAISPFITQNVSFLKLIVFYILIPFRVFINFD